MKNFIPYTVKNHSKSYRIPLRNGIVVSIETGEKNCIEPCMRGDIANRLGEYEAIGSPEEFARLKNIDYDKIKTG